MPRLVETRPSDSDVFARLSMGAPARFAPPRASISVLAYLLGAVGLFSVPVLAQTTTAAATSAPPVAATQLPIGGQVNAGQASISQSGNTLNINQTSQRAVVDWNTFNVGKDATVNFQQPNAQSSTLNRVTDSQPSQILGRITAPGSVVLVNPEGVYFGKSSSVDVGGLVATTHNTTNKDFMDGQLKLTRNGASGKVENDGELRAALGGYIAMLAPEVRNSGVIVANLGTVALAAGESFELKFDGSGALSNVRVTAAAINTLVENKNAIKAPGGLIILSAQAASRLQSGVVNNSGTIEAAGLVRRAGRILLEASSSIFNSGSIRADATGGVNAGPAGTVSLNAPDVQNSGTVSAANSFPDSGSLAAETGRIQINADTFTQTASGLLDVSAVALQAGRIDIAAAQAIAVSGRIFANGVVTDPTHIVANALGGTIQLQASRRVDLTTAVLDASGDGGAGRIHIQADGVPAVPADPANNTPAQAPVHGAVLLSTNTVLRANSARSQAGRMELEGDDISLDTGTLIEAKGATAGGTVLVGGDWQGGGTMRQATTVAMSADSTIDASATDNGDGGKVVLWSDVRNPNSFTNVAGNLFTQGAGSGKGGSIETSGAVLTVFGNVQAGNDGLWLLDPQDIYVGDSYGSVLSSTLSSALNSSNVTLDSTGASISCSGVSCSAGSGSTGNIFIGGAVTSTGNKTLTLKAAKDIYINAPITGTSGMSLDFQANAGSVQINQAVNVSGSLSVASSGKFVTAYGSSITANAGITKVAGGGLTSLGGHLTTTTGNITINGDLLIRKDLALTTTTGNVTVTGNVDSIATTAQTFTTATAGSSLSTTWTAPTGVSDVEVLVVAGGGSGGWGLAGGGGAGGYIYNASYAVTSGTGYSLTVGSGGAKVSSLGSSSNAGQNSVFASNLTAVGGGGGAGILNYVIPSSSGGSGGGGAWYASAWNIGTPNSASSSLGQGNSGGNYTTGTDGGGGGGGALTAGAVGPNGAGGNGITFSISGSSTTYAAGGGGAYSGIGGSSGVGGAGSLLGGASSAPIANTGSGSGGVNQHNGAAVLQPGADGIVIVRYKTTGNSSLTINSGGSQSVLSGIVNLGSGTLTKQGTGTLALNSANTYSGGTTLSAGTLLANPIPPWELAQSRWAQARL